MTDPCPAWPTLLAWLENDLPEEPQLLNTHVADCDECRETLALMNAVQGVRDVGQYAGRGALAGVIERSLSRSRRRGAYTRRPIGREATDSLRHLLRAHAWAESKMAARP